LGALLIHEGVDIVHVDFSPGFLALSDELSQVTEVILSSAPLGKSALQVEFKLVKAFFSVHELVSLCRSISAWANSV
jgi:hypothetical protein